MRVGGNDINALTMYTHIERKQFVPVDIRLLFFYLPFSYVVGLYVRLKIIKEPFVVGRTTYTFIYITDRKVCLCEFALFLSLFRSRSPSLFPFYLLRRFHQILISDKKKGTRRGGRKNDKEKRREHRLQ